MKQTKERIFVLCISYIRIHTSATIRILAAVILGMEVCSKLEAVVGPTHQISSAASVAVIVTSVTRTVTITLTLVTGVLRSAASPVLH